MSKTFNVNGDCKPKLHYMVDIRPKLAEIKKMIDQGQYFTINRARQYGKTTTLRALKQFLKQEYTIVSLDFQRLSYQDFQNEAAFVSALASEVLLKIRTGDIAPQEVITQLENLLSAETAPRLALLFQYFSEWCQRSEKPVVLLIDEVDSATNNQVFLDFLAQLRGYYIDRDETPTFQSVVLSGVYDIKNIQQKFRPDEEHKRNSPWNIAADFLVDLSFSAEEIAGMLSEYEADFHTGMDLSRMSELLYDYTSGYPFLVSRLCKLIDERVTGSERFPDRSCSWTKEGFLEAVNLLLSEKNTLFESLMEKLNTYPELRDIMDQLLFQGRTVTYNPDDPVMDIALMFGFIRVEKDTVQIANRIFETRLYNMFLTLPEARGNRLYQAASKQRNQFIHNGQLDMELILSKFVTYFDDIYGDQHQKFLEEDGRRYFMLYLKPIINGCGNYYVEARTRNDERTDIIIDYHSRQYVVELKIWHGDAYHRRGEQQLLDYLDHYHLKQGYMLSFNFNKTKEIGVRRISLGDKTLIEAVV